MVNAEIASNQESRRVIRLVLLLPVILCSLLTLTGLMGVYISQKSLRQLQSLDEVALGPVLELQDIRDEMNKLSRGIHNFDAAQTGLEREEARKVVLSEVKRIRRQMGIKKVVTTDAAYSEYFQKWLGDWNLYASQLSSDVSANRLNIVRTTQDWEDDLSRLDERLSFITQFIQADVKDDLALSRRFSKVSSGVLIAALVLGLLVAIVSSQILVRMIQSRTESFLQVKANLIGASKMSALGEMAGGIAHEINNPLAIIQTTSAQFEELLSDEPVDRELLRTMSQTIQRTTWRIARIVSGLRTFSRDGSQDPFVLVKVQTLVENTISLCLERLKRHGTELIVEPIDPNAEFRGRETQISQVLLNLVGNADDAIQGLEEKWVRISVMAKDEMIEFRIEDSGPRISEELQKKIFQPFFTTKEIGKGTGMGLSISMGIVKAHGGTLELEGTNPRTCFVIRLPQKATSAFPTSEAA